MHSARSFGISPIGWYCFVVCCKHCQNKCVCVHCISGLCVWILPFSCARCLHSKLKFNRYALRVYTSVFGGARLNRTNCICSGATKHIQAVSYRMKNDAWRSNEKKTPAAPESKIWLHTFFNWFSSPMHGLAR